MLIAISFYKVASIIPTHGLGTSTENIGVVVKGILIIGKEKYVIEFRFHKKDFQFKAKRQLSQVSKFKQVNGGGASQVNKFEYVWGRSSPRVGRG